jgi:hypothetical protein
MLGGEPGEEAVPVLPGQHAERGGQDADLLLQGRLFRHW